MLIAVLTGQRPKLLQKTLSTFSTHAPDVWEDAVKIVVHNTADEPTKSVLNNYTWDARTETRERLGIAEASQLLAQTAKPFNPDIVLRLEDDFAMLPGRNGWEQSAALLENPKVGQIRLRDHNEPVMSRHMVLNTPILWQPYHGHRIATAHYSHQASLMRHEDWQSLFPYRNERDAGRKFHAMNLQTVQLVPGVFTHAGTPELSWKWNGGSA